MFHTPHHASAIALRGVRSQFTGSTGLGSRCALTLVVGILASGAPASRGALPIVRPNPNIERAGVLHKGVLTVALEAKESRWWLHGPSHSPMIIAAFAEPGKPPVIPGPLVRAAVGTEMRLSIRNSLATPVTFLVPGSIRGADDAGAMDSIVIAPGTMQTFTTRATVAGNFMYRATAPDGPSKVDGMAGLLAGAIVVDTAGADTPAHDRVLTIFATQDSAAVACADTMTGNPLAGCVGRRFIYTINGRSWPNTERLHYMVGETVHWRVINASNQVHPMHLHGFYYRVDQYYDPGAALHDHFSPSPGQLVVTQLMRGESAMSISWSPDRPGNWLFHCHLAIHNTPDSLSASADDPHLRDMNGLVLGTSVAARLRAPAVSVPAPVRHLRLVAERVSPIARETSLDKHAKPSPSWLGSVSSMHFVIEQHGRRIDTGMDFSPQLDLTRGEPVAITIVNHLDEPTSVHWHGIEVENSYMDGVPGFSGDGRKLTPAIAPGDSFVVRFTPPRAGTFMYHAHVDELRQDVAGLEGALIVHDPDSSPVDDHVVFLRGDGVNPEHPREIDGRRNPDTLVLRVGHTARLRLLNLSTIDAVPLFFLTARLDSAATIADDTMLVRWRQVAKDGFDVPAVKQTLRPARQLVSVGETYDFEYTPVTESRLQLEVREGRGQHPLLIRVPIRIEP